MKRFPNFRQPDSKDCGPTCIKIISEYYGKKINLPTLRKLSETTRLGSSLQNLSDCAEKIGFRTLGVRIDIDKLKEVQLPCIIHWNNNHFVVLYKLKRNKAFISDPAYGLLTYSLEEFKKLWCKNTEQLGIVLLIEPTPNFKKNLVDENEEKIDYKYLFKYLRQYKRLIIQLIIGLICGSLLQLVVPFLTQSVVDIGIKNQDINFVYLILIAQISLFIGRTSIQVIRSWILLHLSSRINISLISDFFIKLMKLPIAFFDAKMTGDILQRINDHQRIEQLLTTSSLNTIFSAITFILFSFILAYYNLQIFLIFSIGSVLYFFWVFLFLKKRKELDYKRFTEQSKEQSTVIELIQGMQEIKLHNAEKHKRWNWEYVQARLFQVSIKNLALEQYQTVGSSFINELKNIIITVLSAKFVISGDITLGMMLSITYIVGQLNSPIQQFITFVQQFQDSSISLERLSEIHQKENEDSHLTIDRSLFSTSTNIEIQNLSFRYPGSVEFVLDGINLIIPPKQTTAIVGASGSGKTTLMKLLLKMYSPTEGKIQIDNRNFNDITNKVWRSKCGAVMQEGYIFNDTVAKNVALGTEDIDYKKLQKACKIANISSFIENLPSGYETEIGQEGLGLSSGQKQRILIARAVYKDPEIIFFDEATSSLDANNEKEITENLNTFLASKTAIIIAHRLSTVRNADQIVVIDKGKIIEKGTHNNLVEQKGYYYNLVKNQLELNS